MMKMLGIGSKTKSQILWRNISLVIAFITCNLYLICALAWQIRCESISNDGKDECVVRALNSWYSRIMEVLYYSQGIILVLVKLIEPGSLKVHMNLARRLLCCRFKEKEEESIESINVRLDSTLNIEFVYVILEGIIKIARMRIDDNGRPSDEGNDIDVDPEDITVSEDK